MAITCDGIALTKGQRRRKRIEQNAVRKAFINTGNVKLGIGIKTDTSYPGLNSGKVLEQVLHKIDALQSSLEGVLMGLLPHWSHVHNYQWCNSSSWSSPDGHFNFEAQLDAVQNHGEIKQNLLFESTGVTLPPVLCSSPPGLPAVPTESDSTNYQTGDIGIPAETCFWPIAGFGPEIMWPNSNPRTMSNAMPNESLDCEHEDFTAKEVADDGGDAASACAVNCHPSHWSESNHAKHSAGKAGHVLHAGYDGNFNPHTTCAENYLQQPNNSMLHTDMPICDTDEEDDCSNESSSESVSKDYDEKCARCNRFFCTPTNDGLEYDGDRCDDCAIPINYRDLRGEWSLCPKCVSCRAEDPKAVIGDFRTVPAAFWSNLYATFEAAATGQSSRHMQRATEQTNFSSLDTTLDYLLQFLEGGHAKSGAITEEIRQKVLQIIKAGISWKKCSRTQPEVDSYVSTVNKLMSEIVSQL